MKTTTLSESALALLRLHAQCDDIRVDDDNREAHRELAREGLMVVGHSFTEGREVFYRPTKLGRKLAGVLDRITSPSP